MGSKPSKQPKISDYQFCEELKNIISFIGEKSLQLALQFEDQLFQNNIQTYKDLLLVVKEGQFPEFRSIYYVKIGELQQNKFDNEYQNLSLQLRQEINYSYQEFQEIKYSYQIHNPQNCFKIEKEFYILVLGLTGSGKTKFINSLCSVLTLDNHYKYLESVKQILVDDRHLQNTGAQATKEIKKYSICSNYKGKYYRINLIDTPGLSETKGIQQVEMIIDQLGDFLLREVPHLDLILLVSKDQETYNQQEMNSMKEIIKIFGNDAPRYIKQIFTFSSFQRRINENKFKDNILQFVYEKQIDPKYYQFQNSLMTMEGKFSYFDTLRLQKNINNFKMLIGGKFFTKPNSEYLDLLETKKVIFFRKQIKMLLFSLRRDIKLLVENLIINKSYKMQFNDYEIQIQRYSNFNYQSEVVEIEDKQCEDGFTTTFCKACDAICHDRCDIQNERDGCIVFINKKCYSGGCGHPISDHEQSNVIRTHKTVIKTFEYKDLKDAFDSALKFKKFIEDEINLLDEEQQKLRDNICVVFAYILIRDQQLRESALFHEICSNADEYYMDEIKQQFSTQSNFVLEIDSVREQYKQNREYYLTKAKEQLKQLEMK